MGTFTWPDGSTFHGFWEHGKKNGVQLERQLIECRLGSNPTTCSHSLSQLKR